MVSGAKLQVESVRRLIDPAENLSVVYVCGTDRPSWNAMTELAQSGAPVTIITHSTAAAEIQALAAKLPNVSVTEKAGLPFELPTGVPLILIDEHAWQQDLLRDALVLRKKPQVIVCRDGAEDPVARQAKYALLTQNNYYFSGLSGEHSLWTAAKQHAEIAPALLTEMPPGTRALPAKMGGVVHLDNALMHPGAVLRLSARADFLISGWAMITETLPPAQQLYARAQHDETGAEEYMQLPRESRRDVADHFHAEQLLMTGFRADLSPLVHRMGTHTVSIFQSDSTTRYESGPLFQFIQEFQAYESSTRLGLANRYIRGSGIEIGALQKPAQLNSAIQVRYIDRMSLEKLLEHYPEMASIPVQAPDIVDDGQQLLHIAEDSQDFAIANHFLEHCPDPIRSIHNMLRVVKQGGILYLAVPDKRHTFDLRRPVTPYAALKMAYVSGQRSGVADLFYEWCHLVYNLPPAEAKQRAEQLMAEDYSIHYNVWATSDLLSFLLSARHDFQIPFELVAVVSSENENIVLLERTAGRLPI